MVDLNQRCLRDRGSRGTPFINLQKLDEAINEAVMEAIRRRLQAAEKGDDAAQGKTPPAEQYPPRERQGSGGRGVSNGVSSGVSTGPVINITLNPGVDLSNRAEAERMARMLIPAIETLNRRGFRAQ